MEKTRTPKQAKLLRKTNNFQVKRCDVKRRGAYWYILDFKSASITAHQIEVLNCWKLCNSSAKEPESGIQPIEILSLVRAAVLWLNHCESLVTWSVNTEKHMYNPFNTEDLVMRAMLAFHCDQCVASRFQVKEYDYPSPNSRRSYLTIFGQWSTERFICLMETVASLKNGWLH